MGTGLVIDADAAIALARYDALDRVAAGWDLAAPRLLWSEAGNVLHREASRRHGGPGAERDVFRRIVEGPITCVDVVSLDAAWDVADLLGWPKTYDAEYLALARHLGAGMFSLDRQLRSGAARLGIELVTPS